ncbi:MAG: ABC transporter ATP-binding protein [Pyrinomonadaceae bacterium]
MTTAAITEETKAGDANGATAREGRGDLLDQVSASPRPRVSASSSPSPSSPPRAEEIAVRVVGLVKRYADGTEANRGIDLEVGRGEIVSILGANGAGKTTFLRQLTTELRPTAGRVEVFGVDADREPRRAKGMMGVAPQEAGLFESLTVREHFELFARLKGLAKREARAAAAEVMCGLDLVREARRRVGALSGGQRRRILVGLALLGRPPLLVLDEPTTGLDPDSRRAVWQVIRRAVAAGATAILSTHYMEEAERLSDRVAVIAGGRLAAIGTLEELFARLDKTYRVTWRDEFGAERSNLFGTFAEARAFVARESLSEFSIARVSLEDVYFALAGRRLTDAGGAAGGTNVTGGAGAAGETRKEGAR